MRCLDRPVLALLAVGLLFETVRADEAAIRKAVTFYASFDESLKGDVGGDEVPASDREGAVRL